MPRGRPTAWVYQIGRSGKSAALSVPRVVSEQIPTGTRFALEITPEGLLYRFLDQTEESTEAPELPWLKNET